MRLRLVATRREDNVRTDMSHHTAPALVGLRCVFGVGDPEREPPFCPVYRLSWSVGQPGGLDEDDTHEFPAAELLASLQARATRRAWAMRLEVDVEQTAADAGGCELHGRAPEDGALRLLAETELATGGRRLTLGTGLAHTPEAVVRLAGEYAVQHGAEGALDPALVCSFKVGMTEFEFEV